MALQDLAGTRVMDIGPIGVRRGGREIADYGETGVLHAHVRIVFGPFLGADRVLPAGLLESGLPVVHPGDQIRAPLFRGGRIDVIDNRLDGLDKFAPFLLLHVLRTGFQAPAGDETDALHGLLFVGELRVAVGEIAHARVEPARLHRLFRQQDHRCVEHQRHDTGLRTRRERIGPGGRARRCLRRRVVGEGLGRRHLCVDRIGADALDEAGVSLDAAQVVGLLVGGGQGERLVIAFEQGGHLHAGAAFRCLLFGLQRGHDRILGAGLHGPTDFLSFPGVDGVRVDAQEQIPVRGLLPVDHPARNHLSAVLRSARSIADEPRHGQDPAAQQAVGDVEVPVLLLLGDAHQAGGHIQFRCRFFCVFFLFRVGLAGGGLGGGTLGERCRGGDHEQGHGGDQDLFHRYRILVAVHEGNDFSEMFRPVPLALCGKFLNFD